MARTEVDYLEMLPTILHDVIEIGAISKVEKSVLETEWNYTNSQIDNNFIETANEDAIKRFENMLKISAPETDDLETRRLRLIARIQEQAPYTNRVLIRILDSILGVGNYMYSRNVANKTVDIKIELTISRQYDIIVDTLERILPVNMIYNIQLRYNTYNQLKPFTHQQLVSKTHLQLREDPI